MFTVLIKNFNEVTDDLISEWKDLIQRSLFRNVYLSPNIVIPSINHLPQKNIEKLFLVYKTISEGKILVALAVYHKNNPNFKFPFPHIEILVQ